MFLKKISGLVTVIILAFSSTAIAETIGNNAFFHIQVGSDSNGNPILLDLSSVKGTEYIISQKHGDGMAKTTLKAACSQGRLFSKRFSLYTSTGQLTSDNKIEREIFPQLGTADATSMEIVCRAADTRSSQ